MCKLKQTLIDSTLLLMSRQSPDAINRDDIMRTCGQPVENRTIINYYFGGLYQLLEHAKLEAVSRPHLPALLHMCLDDESLYLELSDSTKRKLKTYIRGIFL